MIPWQLYPPALTRKTRERSMACSGSQVDQPGLFRLKHDKKEYITVARSLDATEVYTNNPKKLAPQSRHAYLFLKIE